MIPPPITQADREREEEAARKWADLFANDRGNCTEVKIHRLMASSFIEGIHHEQHRQLIEAFEEGFAGGVKAGSHAERERMAPLLEELAFLLKDSIDGEHGEHTPEEWARMASGEGNDFFVRSARALAAAKRRETQEGK